MAPATREDFSIHDFFVENHLTCGFHYPSCDIHGGGLCSCNEVRGKKSMFLILATGAGILFEMPIFKMTIFEILREINFGDDKTAIELLLSIVSSTNKWIDKTNETSLCKGKICVLPKMRVPNEKEALDFLTFYREHLKPRSA